MNHMENLEQKSSLCGICPWHMQSEKSWEPSPLQQLVVEYLTMFTEKAKHDFHLIQTQKNLN